MAVYIRQFLILITVMSITTSIVYALFTFQTDKPHPVLKKIEIATLELPVRLSIPSINVDTSIQYVGINSAGEMATPSSAFEVGWYKEGVIPGEKGNAVIAGHFDGQKGEAGVFYNLSKLKTGDELIVESNKGKRTAFIVREAKTTSPGYVEEVFEASNSAHLNLVTCGGEWNEDDNSYSERLIVFADKK